MKNIYNAFKNVIAVFWITRAYMKKARKSPHQIEDLKQVWAKHQLRLLKVKVKDSGQVSESDSMLLLGNHVSYIDILLLMATVPKISFVAKAEIENWPIIGEACRMIGIIFVKREKKSSRNQTKLTIEKALGQNRRIVIFASGTTAIVEKNSWRNGPFEIAKNLNVSVQPFRLSYSPLRMSAYIDDDFLPTHLFKIFRSSGIKATIEFHPETKIDSIETDRNKWQTWSQKLVHMEKNGP